MSKKVFLALLLCLWAGADALAQNLEPRRWSHLPSGLHFVGIGYGNNSGEILFDPVLLIEDTDYKVHGLGASYIHSFDWYGKSARIDVLLPYASGRWEGLLDGELTSVRRRGFGDPHFRFSVLLYGAPALKGKAFAQYRAAHPVQTTVGAAVALSPPIGEYFEDKLINLGDNRWTMRSQLGVLHKRGSWEFELTGSVTLFSDNHEFWQGNKREQDPLFFAQAHVVRTFRPGLWIGASAGYAWGAENYVNGNPKNDAARKPFWALSLGLPINRQQGIKLAWVSGRTNTSRGSDGDTAVLAWSFMWGGG